MTTSYLASGPVCSGGFDRRSSTAALCFVQLSGGPTNSNFSQSTLSRPSLCSGLRHGTNYLHLCDPVTRHYKRHLRRTCCSSNCSGTLATLTRAAVAITQ